LSIERLDAAVERVADVHQYGEATSPDGRFQQVSAGSHVTCGLLAGGLPKCWGYGGDSWPNDARYTSIASGDGDDCALNPDGTLHCDHNYDSDGDLSPPAGTYLQVSMGGYFGCAVRTDHTVACWGQVPGTVPSGTFTQVSASDFFGNGNSSPHACGVRTDGTVACWGSNTKGQSTPPAGTFREVSAGAAHTCGVRSNGTVACWGDAPGATVPPGM
jgi:hypothetical protein